MFWKYGRIGKLLRWIVCILFQNIYDSFVEHTICVMRKLLTHKISNITFTIWIETYGGCAVQVNTVKLALLHRIIKIKKETKWTFVSTTVQTFYKWNKILFCAILIAFGDYLPYPHTVKRKPKFNIRKTRKTLLLLLRMQIWLHIVVYFIWCKKHKSKWMEFYHIMFNVNHPYIRILCDGIKDFC